MKRLISGRVVTLALCATLFASNLVAQQNPLGGVVTIKADRTYSFGAGGHQAVGTGVVVEIDEEIIVLTAGHTISPLDDNGRVSRVSVTLNGKSFQAQNWSNLHRSNNDIGAIRFSQQVQDELRPYSKTISNEKSITQGRLLYVNNGVPEVVDCEQVFFPRNMRTRDSSTGRLSHKVDVVASCRRQMDQNGLSGASLIDSQGRVIGVFFADIQWQNYNAVFTSVTQ